MSLNARDDQAEKTKATPPTKASPLTSNQSEVTEKAKEKVGKEKKSDSIKKNEIDEKDKTVAPPQWGLMPLRPLKAKRKSDAMARALRWISLKSPAITAIRRGTTPEITPSQKTNYSLGDLYIGDS